MAHVRAERLIFLPLANDAECDNDCYLDIGPNTKVRIDDAVRYAKQIHGKRIAWSFGAGTGTGYEKGKTLAFWSKRYLKRELLGATMFANEADQMAYGTFEETKWNIQTARAYYPNDKLTFVYFAQPRQMLRVRFMHWLFFGDVDARFVSTRQTFEIPWSHEFGGYLRLLCIKCRIVESRW